MKTPKHNGILDDYKYGFHVKENYVFKGAKSEKGLTKRNCD